MRLRLRSCLNKAMRILRWQRMQNVCMAYKYAEKEAERGAKRAMPDADSYAIVPAVDEEWLPPSVGAPKRRARRA